MGERGKSGIYVITCLPTSKRYVGQAASIGDRWLAHRSHLNCGRHANRHLQSSWKKYGAEAFVFAVLEYSGCDAAVLTRVEQAWVDQLQPEFNLAPVAGSSLGLKHPSRSDEFRQRMSEMKRGHVKSPETIAKLKAAAARSTWHPSPEHIEKLRQANTGRVKSPESIEKHRQLMLGRKQSSELVAKRGAANTGRKRTPEQCARIAEAKKGHGLGRKLSEETKNKIGAAHRGRKRPDVSVALSGRSRPAHVIAALVAASELRYAERVAKIRQAITLSPDASAASIAREIGVNRDTVRKYKAMLSGSI